MKHYVAEISINAPVSKVDEALTTSQGIQAWWTSSAEVGTAVCERITVRFGTTFKVMCIEQLDHDRRMRWKVIEAHLDVPGLTRRDEWIGTEIDFRLEQASPSETRLRLEHIGLTPEVGCYDICISGWDRFLASLKSYVETGMGSPFIDPTAPKVGSAS